MSMATTKLANYLADEILANKSKWLEARVVQPNNWDIFADTDCDWQALSSIIRKAIENQLDDGLVL